MTAHVPRREFMNGGCRHPASISSIRILFLASIEHRIDRSLSLLTRSAVSVIIAIIRRPVSAAVVVCVRVLFLLAWMIISSGVARCLRVGVSVSYALQHANCDALPICRAPLHKKMPAKSYEQPGR